MCESRPCRRSGAALNAECLPRKMRINEIEEPCDDRKQWAKKKKGVLVRSFR